MSARVPSSTDSAVSALGVVPLPRGQRLIALDLMRGLVMVLMALDHSSEAFNRGRVFTDSVAFYHPGTHLPAAQFLTRWLTHLCAPTFLFLAGAGLAFNVEKERAQGKSALFIDRFLLVRGVVIAAFELWISYFVMPKGMFLFQVLYAIGTSYVLMIPLRRLPTWAVFAVSLSLMLGLEFACNAIHKMSGAPPLWLTLLFVGGQPKPLIVAYPTLHWFAIMLLGWVFGQSLIRRPAAPRVTARKLLQVGLGLLIGFLVVRGVNGYGNMSLLRDDGSLVQWLHVSKYPPGLSYLTLELGLCFLGLALFFGVFSEARAPGANHVLLVLGQTPMFFYLLHFPLLVVSAHVLGVEQTLGLGAAYLAAAAVVTLLYPACLLYRRYKAAHKDGWPRYI